MIASLTWLLARLSARYADTNNGGLLGGYLFIGADEIDRDAKIIPFYDNMPPIDCKQLRDTR